MKQLAYVLVNPYTMYKSRTGGVISRVLSRSSELQLIGARMFAPSAALVEEYIAELARDESDKPAARETDVLIRDYVRRQYMPEQDGRRKRVMFLLLEGENAVKLVREEVVGSVIRHTVGETIRDTYGDYIKDEAGKTVYFEPAALIGSKPESARRHIAAWLRHSASDSGILDLVVPHPAGAQVQRTLVMIKPDALSKSRTRMGTVIDLFSKTGLFIIAIKVIHMSIAQAMEFYGPVRDVFLDKLKDKVRERVRAALAAAFEFPVPDSVAAHCAAELNAANADNEFGKIVEFMTGADPRKVARNQWAATANETCLALVYEGVDAVAKIRKQLGSTDPSKAEMATVRKEFGRDIMVNTAHASDSPESAEREIRILDIAGNEIPGLVAPYGVTDAASA